MKIIYFYGMFVGNTAKFPKFCLAALGRRGEGKGRPRGDGGVWEERGYSVACSVS